MKPNIENFIYDVLLEAFKFINPYLTNYLNFSKILTKEIKKKTENNIQYNFDVILDDIFKKQLKKHGISGKIYSEESNFYEEGKKRFRVIFDPFCNSSLASRTFAEAAAGISIFSYDYKFIVSAVIDYQTGIMAIAKNNGVNFFQIQNKKPIFFKNKREEKLNNSWVVLTLENKNERKEIKRVSGILEKAQQVVIGSGHIYWLKLAMGMIDGYLDPIGGEKLYEMFACIIAQKAGCIITNLKGENFDAIKYLKIFEKNPNYVYFPVAAANKKLHRQLLENLR